MDKMTFTLEEDGQKITIDENQVIEMFHTLYYSKRQQTWENTRWLGTSILKCPLDLWVYQEMFYSLQPDLIVETGTFKGASANYYATLCEIIGKGKVVTIDVEDRSPYPQHERLSYISGSGTNPKIVEQVKAMIPQDGVVVVILDSDHSRDHVYQELKTYSEIVSPGSYFIVEDTNVNGHPIRHDFGPGPWEAVEDFLKEDKRFRLELSKEKFMMTQNPHGFLKKMRG